MPLYEYHCSECEKNFEKLVKHSEVEVPCPECLKISERVWSTPSPMVWGRGGRGF